MSIAKVVTQEEQQAMTPLEALERLKSGNALFVSEQFKKPNYLHMVRASQEAQYPFAIILGCIDSRVPAEIIFSQGIGNIFVSRIAAQVLNEDIIAGLEYATKVVGSKLIVVLGHENCGAVTSAANGFRLGHISSLLDKITPAMEEAQALISKDNMPRSDYINWIATQHVKHIVEQIPEKSDVIKSLLDDDHIMIVGAMYHIETGKVSFFE